MRNLRDAGFAGPVMPVNPKYKAVQGVLAYPDIDALPQTPDVAVICTPPRTVPGLIAILGRRGTRAAIVLTGGLDRETDERGVSLQDAMLQAAGPYLLRVLGPNCIGLMVPGIALNASFAHTSPLVGKIALVTQSGAMVTAVLDYANSKRIGFSHFVSLGNSADVDFGDVLDYLGGDPGTRAILLYVESIRQARKFLSAARAAARNKPVLVVKAGRIAEGARAAASHSGAMSGSDEVFDAAIRRAGMLRVNTIPALFDAVETLARTRPLRGERLTILTNGGGPGVMAADALAMGGGRLARLSDETLRQLDGILPTNWSHGNPVDIIGDADAERHFRSLRVLLSDPETDAVLVIHAPVAVVSSKDVAEAVTKTARNADRNVLTCWLGRDAVANARLIAANAGVPSYDFPEHAIDAFLQMVNYRRNQKMLLETPLSVPEEFEPDVERARRVIETALRSGCKLLSEPEAKEVLEAYRIPIVIARVARNVDEAMRLAEELGFPVAVKILSPDITHKTDVGGVALDLETPEDVRAAVEGMARRLTEIHPAARLDGFSVQAMARRPRAQELIVGATTDPIFGPILMFGHGGTAVEVIRDRTVELPPLNTALARQMISRTRVSRLLAGYRDRPPADMPAICTTLMQISQLVADIPEIAELDINPLFADDQGVLALDARMRVEPTTVLGAERLAIKPYPKELEEHIEFAGRPLTLRPIRPEDEPQHRALFDRLAPEDVRYRFFATLRQLEHSQLARYTQIDYDREMVFIASARDSRGYGETLGVVHAVADSDNAQAELAIVVRPDLKGRGLGRILIEKMIRYCRQKGTGELVGEILAENRAMRHLAERLGFRISRVTEDETVHIRLSLSAPKSA
jgi:acetyltransferase